MIMVVVMVGVMVVIMVVVNAGSHSFLLLFYICASVLLSIPDSE